MLQISDDFMLHSVIQHSQIYNQLVAVFTVDHLISGAQHY